MLPSRIDDRGVPVRQSGRSRVAVPVATRCAVLSVHECLHDALEVAFREVDHRRLYAAEARLPWRRTGLGGMPSSLSIAAAAPFQRWSSNLP
jgi:hypothetical protein